MFANTESEKIDCPYCGERIEIVVDCSIVEQSYIEDCQVCCRPIGVFVRVDDTGLAHVQASGENDA